MERLSRNPKATASARLILSSGPIATGVAAGGDGTAGGGCAVAPTGASTRSRSRTA